MAPTAPTAASTLPAAYSALAAPTARAPTPMNRMQRALHGLPVLRHRQVRLTGKVLHRRVLIKSSGADVCKFDLCVTGCFNGACCAFRHCALSRRGLAASHPA
ncbi:hypothetical protein M885DRAFT_565513 [Pelagophyceae sp. CCMP2097]|nr:hypothetical protein M885DRAFT_565513 [Pelagophyceae sp. CCMP2097]